jgi:hypothetical protein
MAQGLVRRVGLGKASAALPSVDVCKKIGSWNVRSLNKLSILTNVVSEMKRMRADITGGGRKILGKGWIFYNIVSGK